jgi:hypothetical protein
MAVKKWAALAVINAEGVFHASGGDIAIATQALEESAVGFGYYECARTDDGAWYFKVFRFMGRLLAEVSC